MRPDDSAPTSRMNFESRGGVVLKYFSYLWPLATVVVAALTIISFLPTSLLSPPPLLSAVIMLLLGVLRVCQLAGWITGAYFMNTTLYRSLSVGSWLIYPEIAGVLCVVPYFWKFWKTGGPAWLIDINAVCVSSNAALSIGEIWFGDRFRQYMRDMRVIQCAEYLVAGDSVSFGQPRKRNWQLLPYPRGLRLRRGSIFLPGDDSLEIREIPPTPPSTHEQPLVQREVTAELREALLHYSRLGANSSWPADTPLWTTVDTVERCTTVMHEVSRVVCSSGIAIPVNVDVKNTHSVFWPLVRALAISLPAYREQLAMDSIDPFYNHFYCYPVPHAPSSPTSPYDEEHSILIMICEPLANHVARSDQAPVLFLIHGVRDQAQANEIYGTIRDLKKRKGNEDVGFVVLSAPELLRGAIVDDQKAMQRICTLHLSESGVLCSAMAPTPPAFYRWIVFTGWEVRRPKRLWNNLPDFSSSAESDSLPVVEDDPSYSTLSLFSMLYRASQIRRKILKCFFQITVVPWSQINRALVEDNIEIAEMLQLLFTVKSYKKDFPALPKEHAIAVLNLTHYILDGGLPETNGIEGYSIFSRRAHVLLNRLSQYLQLLPEEIAVEGVLLLAEHPINHGGFSDIYHGIYTNPGGERIEVALKVLRFFDDKSDQERNVLHDKFSKEALVWYYLKHKNIVPILGVDFATFPSPSRAMVSPWMPLGSVLKYMGEHSPSSPYALELLCDVIEGLNYLHSMNIVHGDLCGRNILINNDRRACLTDFGLTRLVETETTIAASTRGGSPRFMAPELLLLPSDSFGCVCCEIWSEGDKPFCRIPTDAGVVFIFPNSTDRAFPYPCKPEDKAGNSMPDGLWELVQWWWKSEPSERPDTGTIFHLLSEMSAPSRRPALISNPTAGNPVAGASASSAYPNSISLPHVRKGKEDKRPGGTEEGYRTVLFGPLDVDGDPEDIFAPIFGGLRNFVRRDALVEPLLVEEQDSKSLALRFSSLLDANNFAMTWMVHRYDPYHQVSATLLTLK
ncbi:Serine/threonine-protein kinase STY8 [Mycena venus]|uniref:Serine/threonine-protein kinase STY8 n=1 Tax=Mycena venus TaxID=2733690 RepID=A0A8H7D205_9AGAR|nr:Serine/threonine-protein kinase STY8 [Mycena venus]